MSTDRFYMPARVFSGPDVVREHAKDLAAYGRKALIVTGRSSAKKCGVYDDICSALDEYGIDHVLFDEVEENPSVSTVMRARDFGVQNNADYVIGAGGGSPMDTAKAVALMIRNRDRGRDYLYKSGGDGSHVPVVCIPTTCGTGSEVTGISVLTDDEKNIKKSIPYRIFADLALIDGKYLRTAGRATLCNTAFDALAHLYESRLNSDMTRLSCLIAEDGLREWSKSVPVLKGEKQPDETDYENLMRASMLGGMAIAHTGTSLPHGLSYALTCGLGVPHGRAVSCFMAGYLREADPAETSRVLKLSGFSSVDDFEETFRMCCGAVDEDEDRLRPYLRQSFTDVLSSASKRAKAPFETDAVVLWRIVNSGFGIRKYRAVLFDLDGTINDSGPGIMNSVRYSLEKLGRDVPSDDVLRKFVGPSLLYSYMNYCGMTEDEAWKAVEAYRECYHRGECFNLSIYDGIRELLGDLNRAGISCAVVTSKPQEAACKILEHFDMTKYFEAITGPDPDDPSNRKSVLIGRALSRLGLGAEDVIMVGDSRFDIIGAKEAGCDSIGAVYGYGTREELEENGADYLVDSAAEMRPVLGIG